MFKSGDHLGNQTLKTNNLLTKMQRALIWWMKFWRRNAKLSTRWQRRSILHCAIRCLVQFPWYMSQGYTLTTFSLNSSRPLEQVLPQIPVLDWSSLARLPPICSQILAHLVAPSTTYVESVAMTSQAASLGRVGLSGGANVFQREEHSSTQTTGTSRGILRF